MRSWTEPDGGASRGGIVGAGLRTVIASPSERTPTISVVICAYTEDRWDDLCAAVGSVRLQDRPATQTILVVDHNPRLAERARGAFPDLTVVENDGSQGLSDARNRGVRDATSDIVCFLDDDARADSAWLASLAEVYDEPGVIGAGGYAEPVWRGGGRPGWFPEEYDWVVGCSYRGQPTERASVRNFLGCNMSFRREAFVVAGRFDPSVGRIGTRPVGGEETEFCIRVQCAFPDRLLVYEPAARVDHTVPSARSSWSYFRSRCWSEGVSKATVSRLAGAGKGLASERRYVAVTLPRGVLRHLRTAIARRQSDGVRRAAAILLGLAITVAGYAAGTLRHVPPWRRQRA